VIAAPAVASRHLLPAAACLGLAAANAARAPSGLGLVAVCVGAAGAAARDDVRFGLLVLALLVAGWWWGSLRLEALDRSALVAEIDTAARMVVVVTGPVRMGRYALRAPVRVQRFAGTSIDEPALLELPRTRVPEQGAVLSLVAVVRRPRAPALGFDERAWLRRQGVHVVLHARRWQEIGRRSGLSGVADTLRAGLARSVEGGLGGERRALVGGIVLGEDEQLSDGLRDAFRRSGLYHLLAVSGQNVALVAAGALALGWIVGVPRAVGHVGALLAIGGYVLAVGLQPSVIRAGVAGALASVAWLAGRQRDCWHFLLLGALVLLAWNPYNLLDPGFQLSFAAVAAIFVLAPWLHEVLEGYPLPFGLRVVVAVSAACGVATAPVLWLRFGALPLLSIPANALADPAMVPLLGLAGASAALAPVAPDAAAAAAWLNGWCAAYIAGCARLVSSVPFAQATGPAAGLAAAGGVVGTAYAWLRWRRPP
jgi:competence protein ComEC